MADDFADRAIGQAIRELEENLIQASRQYEDAERSGDEYSAADACVRYKTAEAQYNSITGRGQPHPNANGQLSNAQRNFLSRRASLGDDITADRMKDYALAHTRATNAGLEPDTPQYFAAIERSVDTMGDGRQPPLNEREAARLCGISEEEYAAQAAKLHNMRLRGEYK
jgi:hypothetical protein